MWNLTSFTVLKSYNYIYNGEWCHYPSPQPWSKLLPIVCTVVRRPYKLCPVPSSQHLSFRAYSHYPQPLHQAPPSSLLETMLTSIPKPPSISLLVWDPAKLPYTSFLEMLPSPLPSSLPSSLLETLSSSSSPDPLPQIFRNSTEPPLQCSYPPNHLETLPDPLLQLSQPYSSSLSLLWKRDNTGYQFR